MAGQARDQPAPVTARRSAAVQASRRSPARLLTEPPAAASERLAAIRAVYEPYLQAPSEHLLMDLPPGPTAAGATDNWESTAWDFASPLSLPGPNSPFTSDEPDHAR